MPLGKSECAVTSFDDNNYINQDFTTDRTKLLNSINNLQANGGTDYDYGLYKPLAGSLVISKTGKHKKVVVFFTDGQPNQPPQINQIITEANSQGCAIYSVVVGMSCPQSLKDIANQTGGQWFENINTEEDAKNVYQQILQTAQGGDPCTIEWQSGISCFAGNTNVELRITSLNVSANTSYQSPNTSVAKLEFNPTSAKFLKATKDTCITVTVTARNSSFAVSNITLSNASYRINPPTNFTLNAGESRNLTICYTLADSGYTYCKFTIECDPCPTRYYANGGFPGKPSTIKTLKLIKPNGGEVFVAGSDTLITWEGVSPDEKVKIEYSINNGTNWQAITDTATGLSYNWRVPKTPSIQCLARVTAKAGTASSYCDNPDVQICNQVWMGCNLDVDTYRNGDPIPEVTDATAWSKLTTGAWCYNNNDPANGAIYGKLYNWYAVNDPRGLAPDGWHIPSDAEWTELTNCLGGVAVAGGKLKSTGTKEGGDGLWLSPNTGATNSSGFSALPGGYRYYNGGFNNLRYNGIWWSATENDETYAWGRILDYINASISRYDIDKVLGFSVRCVRDF